MDIPKQKPSDRGVATGRADAGHAFQEWHTSSGEIEAERGVVRVTAGLPEEGPSVQDVSTSISTNDNLEINPAIQKPTVSEICLKEALPCALSSHGFHLKIWLGEYIDLLSLLPCSKEFLYKSERRDDKVTG